MSLSTKQYLLRALVAGSIAALSIAAGSYIGVSQSMQNYGEVTAATLRNDSYLDIGQNMPIAKVWLIAAEREVSLRDLIEGRRSLVLFVGSGCGACSSTIRYWNKKLVPRLPTDVQLICVHEQDERQRVSAAVHEEELYGAIAVTVDDSYIKEGTGIFVVPTAVGVTGNGTVAFVASGADRRITAEFLDATL